MSALGGRHRRIPGDILTAEFSVNKKPCIKAMGRASYNDMQNCLLAYTCTHTCKHTNSQEYMRVINVTQKCTVRLQEISDLQAG